MLCNRCQLINAVKEPEYMALSGLCVLCQKNSTRMNNVEALKYCISFFDNDGVGHSVIDKIGNKHWVQVDPVDKNLTLNCSGEPLAFSQLYEPYFY